MSFKNTATKVGAARPRVTGLSLLLVMSFLLMSRPVYAESNADSNAESATRASIQSDIQPEELATLVNNRVANEGRTGTMHFVLTNKRGHQRKRTAQIFHADSDDQTNVAIYFTAPSAIEDTAFLSLDRTQTDLDENWLFLPATERVRRLPASERGDYFMGTDLTYGDIKDNFKFPAEDWSFGACADSERLKTEQPCLTGEAVSEKVAAELGYSRFVASIDPETWFPSVVRYFDVRDRELKQVEVERQDLIGGAWTAMAFTLTNLQTKHSTEVSFTNMEYRPDLPPIVFATDSLEFGVPELTKLATHDD